MLFEMWEIDMAIYTRMGMPVQIVAAEMRVRWSIRKPGKVEVFDKHPTPKQIGKGEVEQFAIWWIKAKCLGPYPDGSFGTAKIGQLIAGHDARGFRDENEFRADGGIREIHEVCRKEQLAFAE